MPVNTRSEAKKHLEREWGGRPEAPVGALIIDYLAEHLDSNYLPLSAFFDATKSINAENKKSVVVNVVNYLTGDALPFLMLELEYIDGEEVVRLSREEASAATKRSINPLSGDFDPELPTKLYVCYSVSEVGKTVLGRDRD